jgi:hypothetical protein
MNMPYVPKENPNSGLSRSESAALAAMMGRSVGINEVYRLVTLGFAARSDLKYYLLGLDPEDNYKDVGKLWLAIKLSGIKPTKLSQITSISRQGWQKAFRRNSRPKLNDRDIANVADAVGCVYNAATREITFRTPVRYYRGKRYENREVHKELLKKAKQHHLSFRG